MVTDLLQEMGVRVKSWRGFSSTMLVVVYLCFDVLSSCLPKLPRLRCLHLSDVLVEPVCPLHRGVAQCKDPREFIFFSVEAEALPRVFTVAGAAALAEVAGNCSLGTPRGLRNGSDGSVWRLQVCCGGRGFSPLMTCTVRSGVALSAAENDIISVELAGLNQVQLPSPLSGRILAYSSVRLLLN